jgi:hypothetical protein
MFERTLSEKLCRYINVAVIELKRNLYLFRYKF